MLSWSSLFVTFAGVLVVVMGVLVGFASIIFQGDPTPTSIPATSTTRPDVSATPPTTLVTFDVDGDGEPEFVAIGGEIVPIPQDASDNQDGGGLVLIGIIFSAALAAMATVSAALINRQGGRKLDALSDRINRLEPPQPDDAN